MAKYGDRIINRLIEFDYYGSIYYAVCVGRNEDGMLICYRAKNVIVPKLYGRNACESPRR